MTKFFKCSLICILICIIVTFTGCTDSSTDLIKVSRYDSQTITTTYDRASGCMTSKTIYNAISKVTVEITYYFTYAENGCAEITGSSIVVIDDGQIIYNNATDCILDYEV